MQRLTAAPASRRLPLCLLPIAPLPPRALSLHAQQRRATITSLPDAFDTVANDASFETGRSRDVTPRSPRIRLIPIEGPNPPNQQEPLSLRKRKALRKSPSEYLIGTLRRHGLKTNEHDVKPRGQRHKVDLSYVNPYNIHARDRRLKPNHFTPGPPDLDELYQAHEFDPTLQSCTAICIEEAYSGQKDEPDWTGAIARSAPLTETYLESKGYDTSHMMKWAQILCTPACSYAASALLKEGTKTQGRPIPIFILMFLLRRPDICTRALKDLYYHALQQLRFVEEGRRAGIDRKTGYVMFVRFLRAARSRWPETITSLTSLGLKFLRMSDRHESKTKSLLPRPPTRDGYSSMTFLHNRALSLLAMPLGLHPMAFVGYQQRAQFDVLRQMDDYSPPILLTQEGYRALTRVQLAHAKTDQERNWALLKAKGWPPWKEDRTAMDAETGPEHGISRAGQILRHMQEAGYPTRRADRAMMIHAGWDEDQTPTIQNRFTVPHSRNHLLGALDGLEPGERMEPLKKMTFSEHDIWAARIRTTRTLEEAWACFVSYDAIGKPHDQCVYLAMFEKLSSESKVQSRLQAYERQGTSDPGDFFESYRTTVVPGDGKEVLQTPENPHERLDPRLQLPTVEGLAEYMLAKGLAPNSKCLAFMVKNAGSQSQAHRYLLFSRNPAVHPLTAFEPTTEEIRAVPEPIFDAYVSLLCSLAPSKYTDPLARAALLMKERRSSNSILWNTILGSMLVRTDAQELNNPFPPFTHFRVIELLVHDMRTIGMPIEERTFMAFCKLFRKRVARQDIFTSGSNTLRLTNTVPIFEFDFLTSLWHNFTGPGYSAYLAPPDSISTEEFQKSFSSMDRNSFGTAADDEVVGEEAENPVLPELSATPTARCLHTYVCALGFLNFQSALCAVTTFMLKHATQLAAPLDQQTNGRLMMRYTIIAIRVFLERPWIPNFQSPEGRIRFARERVELMPSAWGGWPSDEECEKYLGTMWPRWSSEDERRANIPYFYDGYRADNVIRNTRENFRRSVSKELERLQSGMPTAPLKMWSFERLKLEKNTAD